MSCCAGLGSVGVEVEVEWGAGCRLRGFTGRAAFCWRHMSAAVVLERRLDHIMAPEVSEIGPLHGVARHFGRLP